MERYTFDAATTTLTLTAAFAKAANDPNTAEYGLLQKIQSDFPMVNVVMRTHKTPPNYKAKSGEVLKHNPGKNLTYAKMEAFMNALPDGDKYLTAYNTLRSVAVLCNNPYAMVRRWFEAQFPKFRTDPLFYVENDVDVIDFSAAVAAMEKGA